MSRQVHSCAPLSQLSGSQAFTLSIEREDSQWNLLQKTYATDVDVRAGEAEVAGEVLGEVSIAIRFCPFCGCALPEGDD